MNNKPKIPPSPQWDVIYTYTRAQAIADGFQIEVTKTAEEAGIRFPVFITRAVYEHTSPSRPASPARTKPAGSGTSSGCFASPSSARRPAPAA